MPRSHSSHSARTPHVRIVEPFVALITRRRKSNIRAGNNIASAPTCNALSLFFFSQFPLYLQNLHATYIFASISARVQIERNGLNVFVRGYVFSSAYRSAKYIVTFAEH